MILSQPKLYVYYYFYFLELKQVTIEKTEARKDFWVKQNSITIHK